MIESERLLLKHFSGSEKEIRSMMKNWASDSAVQGEYGEPIYNTPDSAKELAERYRREPYRWAVYEKESGECIGQTGLCRIWDDVRTAEIEYCIGRCFQGNGYAGEALEAVISHLFANTDFQRLEAFHRRENAKSGRVLGKSRMHPVETAERFRRQGICPMNEVCYCITAQEWREKQDGPMAEYRWTDGRDEDFRRFYLETEAYYNHIAGGLRNRQAYVPYNLSESVPDVIIAEIGGIAVGCAGLKAYSDSDAEIKRVWVAPDYRRNHIADGMMNRIEQKARELGFRRTILQTRPVMRDAVGLYLKRGYYPIENYPPYDRLEGAACYAKDL